MRDLFCCPWQRVADALHAPQVFLALVRFSLFRCWFQNQFPPREVSTGSGSDRVSIVHITGVEEVETRSLPLPVLTSSGQLRGLRLGAFSVSSTQPVRQHAVVLRDKE